ncbi:MAG: hypothetical protein D6696_10490 [Acidobacteria bacterium]|nr:MAG: hypothetical protein D6696_10490 [Acidobacteriota bacterium]
MKRSTPRAILWTAIVLAGLAAVVWAESTAEHDELVFTDVRAQTAEFIGYESSIELTAEQEAIKKEALTAIPAPCCSDNTAYTCCCPCNMSRSVWGLSNYLIAERGYGVEELRAKVEEWIDFINPQGFSGDVCYTGGCNRPFAKNGCGGMSPSHQVF